MKDHTSADHTRLRDFTRFILERVLQHETGVQRNNTQQLLVSTGISLQSARRDRVLKKVLQELSLSQEDTCDKTQADVWIQLPEELMERRKTTQRKL